MATGLAADAGPPLAKVVVVGDFAVGKTALVRAAAGRALTVGGRWQPMDNNLVFAADGRPISIWDASGSPASLLRFFYRHAAAAVVVCDASRTVAASEGNALAWRHDIRMRAIPPSGSPAEATQPGDSANENAFLWMPFPAYVAVTKTDLSFATGEDRSTWERWAMANGFAGCFFVTATAPETVKSLLNEISQRIPDARAAALPPTVRLSTVVPPPPRPRICC